MRKGKWERGSEDYRIQENRLKSIWQSRRDFLQMVGLLVDYGGPAFDVFYGVSRNARGWLDIGHAETALGYQPADDAETCEPPR